jgi:hypothetical protein
MLKNLFFRNGAAAPASHVPDEVLAQRARQRYDEFLSACGELRQRGYKVQLCFSHLDRSKSFAPEDLVRIDIEVSATKHL